MDADSCPCWNDLCGPCTERVAQLAASEAARAALVEALRNAVDVIADEFEGVMSDPPYWRDVLDEARALLARAYVGGEKP